jgi:hypothetical protein
LPLPNSIQKNRSFDSRFEVREDNLVRLTDAIDQAIGTLGGESSLEFTVTFSDATEATYSDRQNVLAIDNTTRNPLAALSIRATCRQKYELVGNVRVTFGSSYRTGKTLITVVGQDGAWTESTFAQIQEQVERTHVHHWITHLQRIGLLDLFMFLTGAITAFIFVMLLTVGIGSNRLSPLTSEKLIAQYPASADVSAKVNRLSDVALEQLRVGQQKTSPAPATIPMWKVFFILIPIVVAVACLWYLAKKCYPNVMFVWGDMAKEYAAIEQRRNFLWNTVVGALIIGVLGNLFVYALTS